MNNELTICGGVDFLKLFNNTFCAAILLCFLFGIKVVECRLGVGIWCLRGSGVRDQGLELRNKGFRSGVPE